MRITDLSNDVKGCHCGVVDRHVLRPLACVAGARLLGELL